MTPSEKANQIYNKFYGIPLYIKTIKESCNIMIDEIMQEHFYVDTEYSNRRLEYWAQVKDEIKKI
jgi:hypothetical protein